MVQIRSSRIVAALCALALALPAGAWADNAAAVHAAASASCDDPVKGRSFDDDSLDVLLGVPDDFDPTSFRCVIKAENEDSSNPNDGQKGVKGTLRVRLFNQFGSTIGSFIENIKTNSKGYDDFEIDPSLFPDLAGAAVDANLRGAKKLNRAELNCGAGNTPPCSPDQTTLCLADDRYKVEVDWTSPSLGSGQGMVLNSSNTQGRFYFISPNSPDLLVQLLNACSNNDHFWVFASASTSVDFDLTVTDTSSGEVRTYGNELGQPFQAITDTSAFATCP